MDRPLTFARGLRDGAPFLLVIVPFGMLFGVVGTEAGLPLAQVMGLSVVVIAGAAQFTAVQLMQEGAPAVVVILSALAVNLRMAVYSAALTPHLGPAPLWQRALVAYALTDQSFAVSAAAYADAPARPVGEKLRYYAGACAAIVPLWYAFTLAGVLAGAAIPASVPLDFAVPITFLAIVAPMLRTPAHVVAATVAVFTALAAHGLPWNGGLFLASGAAMLAGAETERRLARRTARA